MALAHPTLQQEAREAIACDYFIDALDDADFALKVRSGLPRRLMKPYVWHCSLKPGPRTPEDHAEKKLVIQVKGAWSC